jgi:hypothetical protein
LLGERSCERLAVASRASSRIYIACLLLDQHFFAGSWAEARLQNPSCFFDSLQNIVTRRRWRKRSTFFLDRSIEVLRICNDFPWLARVRAGAGARE